MPASVRSVCRERGLGGIGVYGNVTRYCTTSGRFRCSGHTCLEMVSTDLVTRGIRPLYTPVMILATDDKPDDTALRDYAWTARGLEGHIAGAARCSASAEVMDSRRTYH